MKTKIYILLAVLISLAGIQELNAQDTIWKRIVNSESSGQFTKSGTHILYTVLKDGSESTIQLISADSGRVIWTDDSTNLGGQLLSPDSLTFATNNGGSDSNGFVAIRRLSDGAILKRFDTVFTNNYPRPFPYSWKIGAGSFSNNGRYLFVLTDDRKPYGHTDETVHNYIFKIDVLTGQLVNLRLDSSLSYFVNKPDEDKLICWNRHGIAFYDTESLNEQKSYRDGGIFRISRSGRYITTMHGQDSLITWDTQRDSIIKRNHLDSFYLTTLRYTSNDSIVVLLYMKNTVNHILVYNIFTNTKLNDFVFHPLFDENTYYFALSPDDSKLLVIGEGTGIYMYDLTLLPTAKKDDNPPDAIIRVNPNPALGNVAIELDSQTYYDAIISLYDENGSFVMNIKEGNYNSGMNTITFSTKNLSNGIYFIRVAGSRVNQSSKLIINK